MKDGKQNGKGIYYWPNGDWREGEFKKGNHHGRAIFHSANGKVKEEMWENGSLIQNKKK